MNRTPLVTIIVVMTVFIAALNFLSPAELAGSALFTFPLVLCIMRRSRWLLWGTAAMAVLSAAGAEIWGFHRIVLPNRWVVSANGGLVIATLLTLAVLIHLWMDNSQKIALDLAKIEHHSKTLIARNEQLDLELAKIKTLNKGKRKPLVLTIKQYQAFAGQLSDLHRTMVVAAMCSGMRVSEVLGLRWDQLDLGSGLLFMQARVANGGMVRAEVCEESIPIDAVLLESLLEWRKKNSSGGLVFPSHITGRCYYAGPIQQDYFRPAARKLGLVGVCWHTFPHSYKSWMDEGGTATEVHQKLMRHAPTPAIRLNNGNGSAKPKAKANGKVVVRQVTADSGFRDDVSVNAP